MDEGRGKLTWRAPLYDAACEKADFKHEVLKQQIGDMKIAGGAYTSIDTAFAELVSDEGVHAHGPPTS